MPSLQHSITSLQHSRLHEPHLNVSAAHQLYFCYLYKSISRYLLLYMYACICLAYLNVKVWPVYVDKCILFWSKVNFDWHAIFSLQKLQLFVQISEEQKKEKWRSHMCYIIFLAVQNSSILLTIGDLVTQSLTHSLTHGTFTFDILL